MGEAETAAKKELGAALDDTAKADLEALARATEGRVSEDAATAVSRDAMMQENKDALVASFHATPAATVQSVHDATNLVSNAKTTLKNEDPAAVAESEKTSIDAAANQTTGAQNIVKSKFGLSDTTILAGLAVGAYCAYSLTLFFSTNGKTITVTNVTQLDSGHIQVSYNPPHLISFMLRVNDTLDFSGCAGSDCTVPPLGNGERVDRLIDDHNFVIAKSVTYPQAYTSTPAGSPVPAASSGSTWGTAVVHSSFSNQFIGAVADTTSTVLGSVATVVDTTLDVLAPTAEHIVDTGVNLGKNTFCDIVPFLCNSTIWWILAIVCLVIILGGGAFMFLSKKKG
jgi:hypothetical protein